MQKSLLITLASLSLIAVVFTGCNEGPKPAAEADFRCYQDGVLAPDFTCDPFSSGSITALGVLK